MPTQVAQAQFDPRERVQLTDHLVAPGFINAHTHAAMALLRGVGDDLPLGRWLNERIWPLEAALVSEEFVYDGTRLAALEMLRAGITCCSDMYFYPEHAARGLRDVPPAELHARTAEELTLRPLWVPFTDSVDAALEGRISNSATLVGLLSAHALRERGWATLRPKDAPWPAREAQRSRLAH